MDEIQWALNQQEFWPDVWPKFAVCVMWELTLTTAIMIDQICLRTY